MRTSSASATRLPMNENWTDFEKFVFEALTDLQKEVAALKVKAGIWGGLAGLVAGGLLAFGMLVK